MTAPRPRAAFWSSRTLAMVLAVLTAGFLVIILRQTSMEPGPRIALSWFLGFAIAQPILLERVAGVKQTSRDWTRYIVLGALGAAAMWYLFQHTLGAGS